MGISELECAAGKNSAYEGFGQRRVRASSNLAILE